MNIRPSFPIERPAGIIVLLLCSHLTVAGAAADDPSAGLSEPAPKVLSERDACQLHKGCASHERRGYRLFKANQYTEALAEYQTAYKLVPLPRLLLSIGRCLHYLKRYDEALVHYHRHQLENQEAAKAAQYQREALLASRGTDTRIAVAPAPSAPDPAEPAVPPPLPAAPPPLPTVPAAAPAAGVSTPPPAPVPASPPVLVIQIQQPAPVLAKPAATELAPVQAPIAKPVETARARRGHWAWALGGVLVGGAIAGGITAGVLYQQRQAALATATPFP